VLPRVVTGITLAAVGVLLLLDAWDAIALPAAVIPAVLLVGLGASLIVGHGGREREGAQGREAEREEAQGREAEREEAERREARRDAAAREETERETG
jgi:hypothetical protein